MRPACLLLVLATLSLAIGACGMGGLEAPTSTAIPLAATATRAPAATRPPAAPSATPDRRPTPAATPSLTPETPVGLVGLDGLLVERQVRDFLARVSAGDPAAAVRLHVAEAARAEAERMIADRLAAGPGLAAATLTDVQPADSGHYAARALLAWEDGSSQELHLTLAQETGLWRITALTFGPLGSPTAPPTTQPAAAGGAPLKLAGRLVFQVSSGGDIYTINADGTGLRRLTDGLDPVWSPDGASVALTRQRTPRGVYVVTPGAAGAEGEQRVVDGNPLKEVAWSADGKRLAYVLSYSFPGGEYCWQGTCYDLPPIYVGQIWTVDLDTGEYLSLPIPDYAAHAPAWDPAGTRLVYAGNRGLAWIDLGRPGKPTGLLPGGSILDTSPAFSPDGRTIAYMTHVHNRWEVFRMNADGSGRTQLTRSDPDLDPAPSNVAPTWSPDGKRIAFLSNRDGRWRIYIMNADGSGQRPMFGAALDELGIRYEFATERVVSWTK